MRRLKRLTGVWLAFALTLWSCSSSKESDRILDQLANMEKSEIFAKAEELFSQGEYELARKYYQFVYDSFPHDPLGHLAALRVADTYAVKKDSTSQTEARLRYKDFVNRYPNDPHRPEALLKLGDTYVARSRRPDLDLKPVRDALDAYQQLVDLYPDSEWAAKAKERIAKMKGILADHELLVAQYYIHTKKWLGAKWRLEYIKENYPGYNKMDKVDALLEEVNSHLSSSGQR